MTDKKKNIESGQELLLREAEKYSMDIWREMALKEYTTPNLLLDLHNKNNLPVKVSRFKKIKRFMYYKLSDLYEWIGRRYF